MAAIKKFINKPLTWLKRGRVFFAKDLTPYWAKQAEKLPAYRSNTMAVIASVRLRFLNDGIKMAILAVSIMGLIAGGGILGCEEGANFVRIKTVGWAKDQKGPATSKTYDIFDLRFPQVETGALFLTSNIIRSPDQVRYVDTVQKPAICVGAEKDVYCETNDECDWPRYTKRGFLGDGQCVATDKHCNINAWCNQYRWYCVTSKHVFGTQSACETNCGYCYPDVLVFDQARSEKEAEVDPICGDIKRAEDNGRATNEIMLCEIDDDGAHLCFNRYKVDMRAGERCSTVYRTTNATLGLEDNQFIMEGLDSWVIKFDIFMTFGRYFMVRNIVNEYYTDLNAWTLNEMLSEVGTNYEDVKMDGIIIAANGIFECTLFSSKCTASWKFSRLDSDDAGFGLTHRLFLPGVTLLGGIPSAEVRYLYNMKGIRLLTSVSSKMYAPDPMAALIAIGGVMGLAALSNTITELVMKKISPNKAKYEAHIKLNYETFVKQEKEQLKESFDIAIAKHMKALYAEEQAMMKLLDQVAPDAPGDEALF